MGADMGAGMTVELTALALAVLLHGGLFGVFAYLANVELTPRYTSSPRDVPPTRQMSVGTARLQRTMNNSFEALIYFTPAVMIVSLSGQSSLVTQICALAFVAARAVYIPAYWLGWAPWRSAIWSVGFFAAMIMILAAMI